MRLTNFSHRLDLYGIFILIVLLFPQICLAEEQEKDELFDEFAFLQEQDIVLSAAKHKQKIGFSPAAVIVITRQEIEKSGANDLIELLRRYPAVHAYVTDPIYPATMIRGTIRVLLMVDGREVNVEFYTAPFYGLVPVAIDDIERIEIVLGPNSALYGANAVSAVINITTQKPAPGFHTRLRLAAGQHGNTILGGMVGGGWDPLTFQGSVQIDKADSWMESGLTLKDLIRSNLTISYSLENGSISASAGLLDGGGRLFGVMGYMDFTKMIMAYSMLDFDYDFEYGDFKFKTYWYGLRTDFTVDFAMYHPSAPGVSLGTVPPFTLRGDTLHSEAQYDIELFEGNLLITGLDFRYTYYQSDQLVEPELTQYRFGIFVHDEQLLFDKLMLTASFRFDYNSVTNPAISPRGAIIYNPDGDHFIRLSAGSAFRKPTMIETSANFTIDGNPSFPEIKELFETKGISNADLSNESLTGIELGYRGTLLEKALRISADIYFNMNRNWISFLTDIRFRPPPFNMQIDIDNSRVGYENSGDDFNIFGVNIGIEGEPIDNLTLFLRGEYRYEYFTKDERKAPKTPEYLFTAGGTWRLPFGLTVHLALSHVAPRKDDIGNPQSVLEASSWQQLPAVTLVMANLNYRLEFGDSKLDLGLSFFNPFGGRFREKAGVETQDGSNYGGEVLGTRAMLSARLRY
ncbi:MAG: TonB-dependent receptor [Deltaproteobacteria bacterium]|nr:TonB-dependent receptor [Deltaproteobacteria bacterium]